MIAFVFTIVGAFGCSFVSLTSGGTEGVGAWTYYNTATGSCQTYPSQFEAGSALKAGRAFTVLAVIFSVPMLVGTIVMTCNVVKRSTVNVLSVISAFAGLWVLLSFVSTARLIGTGFVVVDAIAHIRPTLSFAQSMFADVQNGTLGATGIVAIFAIVFWWVLAGLLCAVPVDNVVSHPPANKVSNAHDVEAGRGRK